MSLLYSRAILRRRKYFSLVSDKKICGKVLRMVDRADLKEMGVRTMGRRILLLKEIQALLGSSCDSTSTGEVKLTFVYIFYNFVIYKVTTILCVTCDTIAQLLPARRFVCLFLLYDCSRESLDI